VQPRIFDMHYTTKTTGTGIGLYLARSIVEAHGGEIWANSVMGQGSKFYFTLPKNNRPTNTPESAADSGERQETGS
jgi:signal transduction histidine kinase